MLRFFLFLIKDVLHFKAGISNSSHSTGNLYFTIDKILSSLQSKFDIEVVKKVAASRLEAMRQIESWISRFNLQCEFAA